MLAHHYADRARAGTAAPGGPTGGRSYGGRPSATSDSRASGRSASTRPGRATFSPRAASSAATVIPNRAVAAGALGRAAQHQNPAAPGHGSALEEALGLHHASGDHLATESRPAGAATASCTARRSLAVEAALAEAVRLLEALAARPKASSRRTRVRPASIRLGALPRRRSRPPTRRSPSPARLGLRQPVDALGFRGFARSHPGEQEGLEEMRQALQARDRAGRRPRTAAASTTTSPSVVWQYEGPRAALDLNARASSSAGDAASARWRTTWPAARHPPGRDGQPSRRSPTPARRRPSRDRRRRRLRRAAYAAAAPAHRTRPPRHLARPAADARGRPRQRRTAQWRGAVAAAAPLQRVRGNPDRRASSSPKLDRPKTARTDANYASQLPGLVRTALALDDPTSPPASYDGVQPSTPFTTTSSPQPGPTRRGNGDHREAAQLYADAAGRSAPIRQRPRNAHTHSSAKAAASTPSATPAPSNRSREARDLFASMGYQPALAETEALLRQAQTAAT